LEEFEKSQRPRFRSLLPERQEDSAANDNFPQHCFAGDERRLQITNYIGTPLVKLLTAIQQRNNHASVE
jgi:hypothetical protein